MALWKHRLSFILLYMPRFTECPCSTSIYFKRRIIEKKGLLCREKKSTPLWFLVRPLLVKSLELETIFIGATMCLVLLPSV